MIPKISSGTNIQGAILYNDKEKASLIHIINMSLNKHIDIIQPNHKDLVQVFDDWNNRNPNVKKNVFHCSLNFSHQDTSKLSDDMMSKIGEEFMDKMGYGNTPCLIYKHEDKKHTHIHILSSRVGENRKRIDDKDEIKRAIELARNLEIKYNLFQVKAKGENKLKGNEELAEMGYKNKLLYLIDQALHKERVENLGELEAFLANFNVRLSIKEFKDFNRKGFTFIDTVNNSKLFGSDIHKSLSAKLEKKFKYNVSQSNKKHYNKSIQNLSQAIGERVDVTFKDAFEFENYCKEFNLQPIYNEEKKQFSFHYEDLIKNRVFKPTQEESIFLPRQLQPFRLIPKLEYIQTSLLEKQVFEEKNHIYRVLHNIDALINEKSLYQKFNFSDIIEELNARGIRAEFSYERNKFGHLQLQKFKLYHLLNNNEAKIELANKGEGLTKETLSSLLAMQENNTEDKAAFKEILKTIHNTGGVIEPSTADINLLNKIEFSQLGTRLEDRNNAYLKRYLRPTLLNKKRDEIKKTTDSIQNKSTNNVVDYTNEQYRKNDENDNWILK